MKAIELILSAIQCENKSREDVIICLDVASNELHKNKYKILDDKLLSSDEMIDFYYDITKKYLFYPLKIQFSRTIGIHGLN